MTEAIYDYWRYFDAARLFGPEDAIKTQQAIVAMVDKILLDPQYTKLIQPLKEAMLLPNVTRSDDFANVLAYGIYGLQSKNWDPAINDPSWDYYLGNISSNKVLWPATEDLRGSVEKLLKATDTESGNPKFVNRVLNFVGWNNLTAVSTCDGDQDKCFTGYNDKFYKKDDLKSKVWRSWAWQYCTEWGFLQTGSGAPSHILPVVSRAIDLHYTSEPCSAGFGIHKPAKVGTVNKYGGFGISYPRLAIIDGDMDPWRQACPHALGQPRRKSTVSEPYLLIKGGAVHHWDENGLFPNETTATLPPKEVADAQAAQASFVKEWLKDFKGYSGSSSDSSSGPAKSSVRDASSSSASSSSNYRGRVVRQKWIRDRKSVV